jgi:hypothetical protein
MKTDDGNINYMKFSPLKTEIAPMVCLFGIFKIGKYHSQIEDMNLHVCPGIDLHSGTRSRFYISFK